jgi:putative ABC transport system permease protein
MFGRRSQKDFAAEIQAHVELEAARLRGEGLSATDALHAARRAFGNATAAEERFYESRRWLWWEEIRKDLLYTVRTLRQNPLFTIAAVVTLALGIGANTAIFSVIDTALLRPLPYPEADRIVALLQGDDSNLSPPTFLEFRKESTALRPLAAYNEAAFNFTQQARPERISGAVVTPDFFAVMGVQAQLGRTLDPKMDAPGQPRTVVLGYSLWQSRYGANADVLGQTVQIDGEPVMIVGVMPASFQYPPGCEAWKPARFAVPEHPLRPYVDQSTMRDTHYFNSIGRLKPGISLAQATTESNIIARRLKQQYGSDEEIERATLIPLHEELVGETRPALLVLLGAVALLLVIACVNVANILLARGATRQREIAIRGAMGASRARLARQFLTESLVLGLSGGGLGILLAHFSLTPLRALLPVSDTPLQLDGRVLAFTAVVSVCAAVFFGLFPAMQAARFDLNGVLKEGGRGSGAGPRAQRARSILVIAEVALAGVLLIGAGLLLRSFGQLLAVPEGFAARQVLSLQVSLPATQYPKPPERARFVRDVLERMRAIPGVTVAAAISRLPMNPGNSTRSFDIKGRTSPEDQMAPDYLVATPDYFRAMGIRLVKGRAFTEHDGLSAPPVIIVNQAMARLFLGNGDPLNQFISVGGCGNDGEWCQVVGVVDDVHQHGLDKAARPAIYVPYARDPWTFMSFVVQTGGAPGQVASAAEAAVHAVDREQAVYNVRTMDDVISKSLSPRRLRMLLIGAFAALALILACVGIYGVMAYAVVQRNREIGIRIALGASRSEVVRVVVAGALKLALAGVAIGAMLSFALTRFLAQMLFGVRPTDAGTFAGVCGLLIVMALVSSYIPAWRATRVDPLTALRME